MPPLSTSPVRRVRRDSERHAKDPLGRPGALPPARPHVQPYRRRHPETTSLYRIVQEHLETYPALAHEADPMGDGVPGFVEDELRDHASRTTRPRCGILAHGFARARCASCDYDFLVALSCKGRGACPSCNAKGMAQTAAHLVDHVFPPTLPSGPWSPNGPTRTLPPGLPPGPDLRSLRPDLSHLSGASHVHRGAHRS